MKAVFTACFWLMVSGMAVADGCVDRVTDGECSFIINEKERWAQVCVPAGLQREVKCLPGLDFATFARIRYPFSKDRAHVYYYARILEGAVPSMVHVFDDHVASDGEWFYVDGEKTAPTPELRAKYRVDEFQRWLEREGPGVIWPRDASVVWDDNLDFATCLGQENARCVTGAGTGVFTPGANLDFADFKCVAVPCASKEVCGYERGYWDCRLFRGQHPSIWRDGAWQEAPRKHGQRLFVDRTPPSRRTED